jgi:DNA-binding GntR family transcriptional regulator
LHRKASAAFAEDLHDITETRVHIETLALRLAIEHGGDAWEAAILAAHHRLDRRPRTDALLIDAQWEELHRAYHIALLAACGLPQLLAFYRTLTDNFDRYRRLAVLTAGRHPRPKATHAAIVKAVLARDSARAEKLLIEHVRNSASQIMTLFATRDLQRLWPAHD